MEHAAYWGQRVRHHGHRMTKEIGTIRYLLGDMFRSLVDRFKVFIPYNDQEIYVGHPGRTHGSKLPNKANPTLARQYLQREVQGLLVIGKHQVPHVSTYLSRHWQHTSGNITHFHLHQRLRTRAIDTHTHRSTGE